MARGSSGDGDSTAQRFDLWRGCEGEGWGAPSPLLRTTGKLSGWGWTRWVGAA